MKKLALVSSIAAAAFTLTAAPVDFASTEIVKLTPKGPNVKLDKGVLSFAQNASDKKLYYHVVALPVKNAAKKTIAYQMDIKADHITQNGGTTGLRVLIYYKQGKKASYIPVEGNGNRKGTYDWKTIKGSVNIPADAAEVSFQFGLRGGTGIASFRNLDIEVK